MNETRALIQKIEQDFAEYVENLRQLDEQIDETPKEKEVTYQETKKVETKDLEDIESEIDKISEELSKE